MKKKFNEQENGTIDQMNFEVRNSPEIQHRIQVTKRPPERGRTAVWQARLVLLIMVNLAQLWALSASVEAALARDFKQLLPLVIASGVCWLIALSIFLWWKPAPRRRPSSGYLKEK